jgi:hypothetical protein
MVLMPRGVSLGQSSELLSARRGKGRLGRSVSPCMHCHLFRLRCANNDGRGVFLLHGSHVELQTLLPPIRFAGHRLSAFVSKLRLGDRIWRGTAGLKKGYSIVLPHLAGQKHRLP